MADPLSRNDIRQYARQIRKAIGCENQFVFPVGHFLEAFPRIIRDEDFYINVVEDKELSHGRHAEYDIENNCIRIKESVYDGALDGMGRDRMTVIHELGHVLLIKVNGIKLYQVFGDTKVKPYRDPEWQAKCFAGELLIPAHLVAGMHPHEVADKCGVSIDAAITQLRSIKK